MEVPSGGVQAEIAACFLPASPAPTMMQPGVKRKRFTEQWCLTCGTTASDYWPEVGLGVRVMVTLVLGAAHRHFNDKSVILCRACSRACGEPATVAAFEALVVSSPSLSGQHQMRLREAQLHGLRDSLRLLRDDYACRGGVVLFERLLALDQASLPRSGLLLLPVPSGFEVSISNR